MEYRLVAGLTVATTDDGYHLRRIMIQNNVNFKEDNDE